MLRMDELLPNAGFQFIEICRCTIGRACLVWVHGCLIKGCS